MPRAHRPAAAALACAAVLTGCTTDLAFRVDDRVRFVSPTDRADVRLPVTLDWEVEGFEVTGPGEARDKDSGYFAVFVDRAPMPPGKSLRWLARKDNSCRPDDGCPDEEYLRTRGVYTTTATELVLEQLPRVGDEDRRERHRATVVLLDAAGHRIGESAYEIAFDVERENS